MTVATNLQYIKRSSAKPTELEIYCFYRVELLTTSTHLSSHVGSRCSAPRTGSSSSLALRG